MQVSNVLFMGFNERDTKTIEEKFSVGDNVILTGMDIGEDAAIKKNSILKADMILINITDNIDNGISIIRKIRSMIDQECPPFFIVALQTEENDVTKNPILGEISEVGMYFHRYGEEQTITDIIEAANFMSEYVPNRASERK